MNVNKKTSLSCEQVYEIWKNEPHLISIIDLRDISSYKKFHIPGSIHIEISKVMNYLSHAGEKLVIMVAAKNEKLNIEKQLYSFNNFALIRDFNQWMILTENSLNLTPIASGEILEVTCKDTYENSRYARLIDVRRPDEFNGELGHIEHAELISLGDDLTNFLSTISKDQTLIFICRSGKRSESATIEAQNLGFKKCFNMIGGMIQWNEDMLPVRKN